MYIYEEVLPHTIKAFIVSESDGSYTVYVNSTLSDAEKIKAVEHELEHVARGDLHTDTVSGTDKEKSLCK